MTRDTSLLWEIVANGFYPQEVPLVSFTLQLSSFTRKQLYRRLRVSKNAIFGLNSLPGFWTQENPVYYL